MGVLKEVKSKVAALDTRIEALVAGKAGKARFKWSFCQTDDNGNLRV